MDYINAQQQDNDVVVTGLKYFNLEQTLDCGQAFRWVKVQEGHFSGVAYGQYLEVLLADNELILKNTTLDMFNKLWANYFHLNQPYGTLRDMFTNDHHMIAAMEFSPGLRLMQQDPWEIIISFILSQNSNIPRIKTMIESLCAHFGTPIETINGDVAHTFPDPKALASLTPQCLAPIKTGYRAPYILDAAQRVACGKLDLQSLATQSTAHVREALLTIHGVGPKVADCVLLFGFGRLECFPLDVWMKRVMSTLYPNGLPNGWQTHAGIAQQFLFHYARVHGL